MSRLHPVRPYLLLMRPRQWVKSFFVIAPIFFALKFDSAEAWWLILIATAAFLSASCMVYIFNDLRDIEEDQKHPVKSLRPLAAGMVDIQPAVLLGIVLFGLAVFLCLFLPEECFSVILVYLLLNIAYTLYFRQQAMVDVVVLACFYILRVLMGCAALGVAASPWIILATFFLALTIGFAKRYHELTVSGYAAIKPNLQGYSPSLIHAMLNICVASSLMTYAIYVTDKETAIGSDMLVYSIILVAAGLFRFLQLVLHGGEGGEPERVIIGDARLRIIGMLWFIYTIWQLAIHPAPPL